ncbi:unnamed protein product, partial [Mesorhabditis belari]|uniref:K Homology domain-containing protein n=1 Tax=Mesorhabditis belari TaxID=2138241 RepID=A0AAF3EWK4_9BILA
MNFPLYTKTYSVSGRNYRRNPYNGKSNELVFNGGDTADLYADDYEDEALDCIPDFQRHDSEESEPEGQSEQESAVPKPVTTAKTMAPPPGLPVLANIAPPPGFEKKKDVSIVQKKEVITVQKQEVVEKKEVVAVLAWAKCVEDERVEHNGQKWRANIEVSASFYGRLIGFRGVYQKEMEKSTQCRLKIPGKNDKNEIIEISSTVSHENVIRCLDRIEMTVIKARKEARPTHFACFPVAEHQNIVESFQRFKELVKASSTISDSCKDELVYMLPRKLHFTLAVMKLFTKEEKSKASAVLKMAQEKINAITGGKPISVQVVGLEIMNDDPANVNVLYGTVKGDFVQKVANVVRDLFAENDLCENDKLDVKLHMTLMNSRYIAEENHKKRPTFDAKELLKEMGDFNFGEMTINKVLISSMTTEGPNGFYESLASLNL